MLAVVTLTLLPMSLKAQSVTNCYDNSQLHDMAEFKKSCDKCSVDLIDTNMAFRECSQKVGENPLYPFLEGTVIGALVAAAVLSLVR